MLFHTLFFEKSLPIYNLLSYTSKLLKVLVGLISFAAMLLFTPAFAADVTLTVNWPSYSGENSVQIYNSSNTSAISPVFTDGSGGAGDTAFSGTSPIYSLTDGATYTVRMIDSYGDGWNSDGDVTVTVDGVDVRIGVLSGIANDTFTFVATPTDQNPPTACKSTASNGAVMLDFADPGVDWPVNTYTPQTFNDVGGDTVDLSISISDSSTFTSAADSSTRTGNGDTAPFFITSGLGAGSSTFTFDFAANPTSFVDLCIYHINLSGGGDKAELQAVTDAGTILTNPTFSSSPSPTYTISGNIADATGYTTAADGMLGVNFQAPAGEKIERVEFKWSESTGSSNDMHGIGFGLILFDGAPVITSDYSDGPANGSVAPAGGITSYGVATHTILSGVQLGTNVTNEPSAVENADNASDDGVVLPTLTAGSTADVVIAKADITASGTGTLHAWIDFNGDGQFSAAEYASTMVTTGALSSDLTFSGYGTTMTAGTTYARFRLTSDSSLQVNQNTPASNASDGEVEDYSLTVQFVPTGPAFSCTADAYMSIAASSTAGTSLYKLIKSGANYALQLQGSGDNYNALGYSSADNYMYGIGNSRNLVRVFSDGTTQNLGDITGLPAVNGFRYVAADMDGSGNLYVADDPTSNIDPVNSIYVVNVDSVSVTQTITLSPPIPSATNTFNNAYSGSYVNDLAYSPADNHIYAFIQSGHLYKINPATGASTLLGSTVGIAGSGGNTSSGIFGAVFADQSGALYGIDNITGDLYAFNRSTGAMTYITVAQSGTFNDGAACNQSSLFIQYDYSDGVVDGSVAPVSGTTAYGEAIHKIDAALKLGAANTAEASAVPDADNTADDGISSFPTLTAGDTNYTIPGGNISGTGSGTLHAWIDFDGNGKFSAGEYAWTELNAGVAGDLIWSGQSTMVAGTTWARFRLTSDALTDTVGTTDTDERSISGAFPVDGEVEDYVLTVTTASSSGGGSGGGVSTTSGQCPIPSTIKSTIQVTTSTQPRGNSSINYTPVTTGYTVPTVNYSGGNITFTTTAPTDGRSGLNHPQLPPNGEYGTVSEVTLSANIDPNEVLTSYSISYMAGSTDDGFHVEVNDAIVVDFNELHWGVVAQFQSGGLFDTNGGGWAPWDNEGNPEFVVDFVAKTVQLMVDTRTGGRQDALPFITSGTFNAFPTIDLVAGVKIGTGFSDSNGHGPISDQQINFTAAVRTPCLTDYSDAPVDGSAAPVSGTTAYGEAIHNIDDGLKLGATNTAETSAVEDADNTADDGITLPSLAAGDSSYTIAPNNISVTGTGSLHAWVDFDGNGIFDADEHSSTTVNNGTPTTALNWTLDGSGGNPDFTVASGSNTFARFRLTSDGALQVNQNTPANHASDGEVEDYAVTVTAASDIFPRPTQCGAFTSQGWVTNAVALHDDDIRFGSGSAASDPYLFLPLTRDAAGRVLSYFGTPDETFSQNLPTRAGTELAYTQYTEASHKSEYHATVFRLEGAPGTSATVNYDTFGGADYSAYWLEDSNGNVLAAADFVYTREVSAGGIGQGFPIPITYPADGVVYVYTVLFDPTMAYGKPSITGYQCPDRSDVIADGQVAPDGSVAATAYGDTFHNIVAGVQLGAAIDSDATSIASVNADGDGADDDGVTIPTLTAGSSATITADVIGAGGYLQAWIDWNGDGDFLDTIDGVSEQISINAQDNVTGVAGHTSDADTQAGQISIAVSVPASAITTQTFGRFRWSSTQGLDSTTAAGDGEVEDYQLLITAASTLTPFVCQSNTLYQGAGMWGDPTQLRQFTANNLVFDTTPFPNTSIAYNAFGYRTQDNYLYGIENDTTNLVRIGSDGGVENLGAVPGLSAKFYNAGDVHPDGTLWIRSSAAGEAMYQIDVLSKTILNTYTLPTIEQGSDFTFSADGNTAYMASSSGGGDIYAIDFSSGTPVVNTTPVGNLGTASNGFGAQWSSANGLAYFYQNSTGSVYVFNPATGATAKIASNALYQRNDGASCRSLFLAQDYSDALNYGDATHSISPDIYLGSSIDADSTSIATADANGDGADDDGVFTDAGLSSSLQGATLNLETSVPLHVVVKGSAKLYAWVDWNNNGVFGDNSNELIANGVAGNNETLVINANVPLSAKQGAVYARFRLSSDSSMTTPLGAAADGEVEDYQLTVANNPTVPTAAPLSYCSGSWTLDGGVYKTTTAQGMNITASATAQTGGAWSFAPNDALNAVGAFNLPELNGAPSLSAVYTWDTSPEDGRVDNAATDASTGTLVFSFDTPVTNPVIHIDRQGGYGSSSLSTPMGLSNSSLITPAAASASATFTKLAGTTHFEVTSNSIQRTPNETMQDTGASGASGADSTIYTAMGSVQVNGTYSSLSLDFTGIGVEGAGADGVEFVICAQSSDYGDAPDGYGTTHAANGAEHEISQDLYLGSTLPDADADGQPSSAADRDGADEDGVLSVPALAVNDRTYSLVAQVTNDLSTVANLVAWIDFDGNGTFDADEAAIRHIPANSGLSNITLNWSNIPVDIKAGDSYLRLRVTTDSLSNRDSGGVKSDGEVEDYPITIKSLGVTVSGRVFQDVNVNTTRDSSEAGVTQLPVVLYDTVNKTCVSTRTNGRGDYQFTDVVPGQYQVYEASRERVSIPRSCDPALAKDPSGYRSTTNNVSAIFTVAGTDIENQDFGDIKPPQFEPDHQSQVLPGNVLFYAHRFTTPTKGSVNFSSVSGENQSTGWNSLIYQDSNCNGRIDGVEASAVMAGAQINVATWKSNVINVSAGSSVCLINKVYAPSNVAANDRYIQTITADFDYNSTIAGKQALSVQDVTTAQQIQAPSTPATPAVAPSGAVSSQAAQPATPNTPATETTPEVPSTPYTPATDPVPAQPAAAPTQITPELGASRLELRKTVRNIDQGGAETETANAAAPGETLEYRIYYRNSGTGPLTELVVNDVVPPYTQLLGVTNCGSLVNGMTCVASPLGLDDRLTWTFSGTLAGGQGSYVSYRVKVDK